MRVTFERCSSLHEGLVRWLPWLQAVEPQCLSIDAPAAMSCTLWMAAESLQNNVKDRHEMVKETNR